jgi:regulatory protein
MAKITALVAQTRNPNRVSVFLDGKFAFGLSTMSALELKLAVGRELEESEIEGLQRTLNKNQLYDRVLRLLSLRSHSRAELMRKLAAKGVEKAAAQEALATAEAQGYLDDGRFAQEFARQGRDLKGWAPVRARMELRKRGVGREEIEAALSSVYAEIDPLEQAITLARARVRRFTGDRESRRRRLASFLARRGFPTSVCHQAVDEVAP